MSSSPGRVTLVARRSRRRVRPLVLVGLLVGLGVAGMLALGTLSDVGEMLGRSPGGEAAVEEAGEAAPPPAAFVADDAPPDLGATPIARTGAVELVAPVSRPVLLGFHEAGEPEALELDVLVPLVADLTGRPVSGEVVGPDGREPSEPTAIVLPSRGRVAPAASALDVVARDDEPVVAPVRGQVVAVERYRLYGRHDDVKVVIRPDADPELEVVLLHLVDVAVEPGDEVVAGRTVIARGARSLPFGSQVDRYTRRSTAEPARPHVHLEVRRRATAEG